MSSQDGMADGIPEGLMFTRPDVAGSFNSVDRLEAEDAQKLYKVYSILMGDVGSRLENLFWRIWSSDRIRSRLRGTQVAKQFDSIINGEAYIRTTPTASPRSSRSLPSSYIVVSGDASSTTSSSTFDSTAETQSLSSVDYFEDGQDTPTPSSPFKEARSNTQDNRRSVTTMPPPILKKSGSGSGGSTGSPNILPPAQDQGQLTANYAQNEQAITDEDDSAGMKQDDSLTATTPPSRRYTSTRFSEEVSVSIPKVSTSASRLPGERSARSFGESNRKLGKRNPIVHASTGASKRRPPVMRQRSSQSSYESRKATFWLGSSDPNTSHNEPASIAAADVSSQGKRIQCTTKSRSQSPHPSRHRNPLSPDDGTREDTSERSASENNTKTTETIRLAEPDFKARFVNRLESQHRSFTDLPTITRKSSAVAVAASFQATGTMDTRQAAPSGRGKGREAFINETIPLKGPAPAGPESRDGGADQPLQRTKSQLTLLLERSRSKG